MIQKLTTILIITIITFLLSCNRKNDYLLLFCNDNLQNEDGIEYTAESCGYMTKNGDITIPAGKYVCFTDTFRRYAVVYDYENFIAIDREENIIFQVFPYDNGPDYPSEGLFRIVKNEKIGFARESDGKIVIHPIFNTIYPFKEGLAAYCENCEKVHLGEYTSWENGKWGFINRKGKVVIQPQYEKIIQNFENGVALVFLNGEEQRIDKNGKTIH